MAKLPYVLQQIEPYIHVQSVPITDITIQHDKDKPCPVVILLDADGSEFEAEIRRPDTNHIRVLTNAPITFTAYIY